MIYKNNKANTEFKIVIFGFIFMILLNISLGFIIDPSQIQNFNEQDVIDDIVSELGLISGTITSIILNMGILFFGLFGINFIAGIVILPPIVLSLITFFNLLVTFSLIFYIVEKIWF